MTSVVGVRFKDSGKIYHFDPGDVPLLVGDWAVVETARGPELGRVAAAPANIPSDEVVGEIKPVLRRASEADWASLHHYEQYLDEALALCADRVREHRLPMHLIKAEYSFDGSRLTFFFTSDKRVDFRTLVRDLARTFHTRIELRQVGPRDEAKLLGGIGPCGRPLCCSTFLPTFAQVSIKMAKDQDLPLNPTKVSGVCGRLLCCLSYEQEQYLEIKAELPPKGAWVQTPEGPGEVIAVNVVRETVTVHLLSGAISDVTAAQISAVVEQVANEARRRNAEGITPVTRKDTGATEGLDHDVLTMLDQLEDPPLAENRVRPTPPRELRPEATLAPTRERGRLQPSPSAADRSTQTTPSVAIPKPSKPAGGQPQPRSLPHSTDPVADTSGTGAIPQEIQRGAPAALTGGFKQRTAKPSRPKRPQNPASRSQEAQPVAEEPSDPKGPSSTVQTNTARSDRQPSEGRQPGFEPTQQPGGGRRRNKRNRGERG